MRRVVVILLLLLPLARAYGRRCGDDVDGRPVPCDCGDLLVSARTLTDVDPITGRACSGPGLLVDVPAGRPGPTLDLTGHVLAGTGVGIGIQVLSGGDGGLTIRGPGAVRGFGTGVQITAGGLAGVTDVIVADNSIDGLDVAADGYTISGCEALHNGRDGFSLRGARYHVDGNRALQNRRYGFHLAGRDGVLGATAANEAAGNGRDGLRLRGRGHDVTQTVVTANGRNGILAHVRGGRIVGAVTTSNRGRGQRVVGADVKVSGTVAHDNRGGNRAEDCSAGAPCR